MNEIEKAIQTISDIYSAYLYSETDTLNLRPYDEDLQEVHTVLEQALREKQENDRLKAEGKIMVLPVPIGTIVLVSPNNGKSFHTGHLIGVDLSGFYCVFITDTVTDFVEHPSTKFFHDWFRKLYTKEDAEKSLEGLK